ANPAAEGGKKSRPLSRQSWLRWGKPSGGLILTGWDLAKGAEARCAPRAFFEARLFGDPIVERLVELLPAAEPEAGSQALGGGPAIFTIFQARFIDGRRPGFLLRASRGL
ncbi:MAG TPA: hypothetical protein VM492_08135, partial [Sumerlaeia bacterium]|nr:hypothetical protein [Sumerlaeia bacterium]